MDGSFGGGGAAHGQWRCRARAVWAGEVEIERRAKLESGEGVAAGPSLRVETEIACSWKGKCGRHSDTALKGGWEKKHARPSQGGWRGGEVKPEGLTALS